MPPVDKTTRYDTLTHEEYMRFRNSGKNQEGSSIDKEKVQPMYDKMRMR